MQVAVALILLGGGLNAAAIAANGRMPYSESALVSAQVTAEQRARGERSPKHVAADDATRLSWLGDVIPVRPIKKVVSLGDLILLAGVAALLAAAMRPPVAGRRDRATRAPSPALPHRRPEPGGRAVRHAEPASPGERAGADQRPARASGPARANPSARTSRSVGRTMDGRAVS